MATMPSIASRKAAATYSRRKTRSAKACDVGPTESPPANEDRGGNGDDTSLSKMAHSMKKRSMDVLRGPVEIENSINKKSKQGVVFDDGKGPDILAIISQRQDFGYETPFHSPSRSTLPPLFASPKQVNSPDKLSPVPKTRSIHRTGSKMLKENSTLFRPPSSLGLSSPFSSRPGSVAGSPTRLAGSAEGIMRPKIKKTPYYPKARTLSNTMKRSQDSDSIFSNSSAISAQTASRVPSPLKDKPFTHKRAPSLPSDCASSLDDLDAQDWSIPPKAVLRTQAPHFPGSAASFIYDASTPFPELFSGYMVAASTPARHPLANKTPEHNTGRIEAVLNDSTAFYLPSTRPITPDSPVEYSIYPLSRNRVAIQSPNGKNEAQQDGGHRSRAPTRPRRRTVVHLSSDSIFSSPLDFTVHVSRGSMLDGDRTRSLPGSAGRTKDETMSSSSMDLTSLKGTPYAHIRRASESSMDITANVVSDLRSSPVQVVSRTLRSAFATPANSPSALIPAASASSDCGDYPLIGPNHELGNLFSGLGLEELKGVVASADASRDSTSEPETFSQSPGKRRTRAGTIRPSDYAWNSAKDKGRNQGRNRAGTIRASDFGQGKGSTVPQLAAPPAGRPRGRSRSGTVSASKSGLPRPAATALASIPASHIQITKLQVARNERGSSIPLPTMKVKVHDRPLSPPKPGEPDDELLLVSRSCGGPQYDTEG